MADRPFAAEEHLVKLASGLYGTISADLSVFGGILRCGKCLREQPLGDVGAYVARGWPQCCGLTMTWVTRKLLAAEGWPVPDGYELTAVVSEGWRLESGKECRRITTGRRHCRAPSAAELNRGYRTGSGVARPSWWPYCINHLYGHWIEQGKVWNWALREIR